MQDKQPKVAILLPVYNGERTLRATLESLLAQTFGDFELLIGIDGTKDGSKGIAESFQDPRIRIIEHPKNLGLANNVNALLAAVSPGIDLIAMAEQDDVYVPERLQWQVEVMQKQSDVGLVSGIAEFQGNGAPVLFPGLLVYGQQFPQGEALFRYLYEHQLKVVNTCILFRKSVHEKAGLNFRNTYGNFNVDWDYILRFSLVSGVYGIPKVLVRMNRRRKHHSVTTNKQGQHKASRQLLKDFRTEFPNLISQKDYQAALKQHRKIELGHRSKLGIVAFSLFYAIIYRDFYFIEYIFNRVKKYKLNHDKN
ncbi:glycosyltransferase [Mangrovimonas sp. AS39]|uniref:glycosyltransferase family 2 protein n=1 Tax=Mangrovimonas futianensis TaxID=2895523 RepID=UPI001E4FC099|nr:glycosyltransferase [Mangrovimonas futianensis]MCF1191235.1 glycosyltransferase [Mangrovimonas futianensis]MCF1194930.1 glycosyltransferase [Mangrovimonas futianensis]